MILADAQETLESLYEETVDDIETIKDNAVSAVTQAGQEQVSAAASQVTLAQQEVGNAASQVSLARQEVSNAAAQVTLAQQEVSNAAAQVTLAQQEVSNAAGYAESARQYAANASGQAQQAAASAQAISSTLVNKADLDLSNITSSAEILIKQLVQPDITSSLSSKVNLDGSNATFLRFTEYSGTGANEYLVLSNNLCFQWGNSTRTANPMSVTFEKAYSAVPVVLAGECANSTHSTSSTISSRTTTGFAWASGSTVSSMSWLAIGFIS